MRLEGKTAIVTGAASGFGREIARRFAREGAKIAIVDLNADGAQTVADELGEAGLAVACDVSKADDVAAAVARTTDAFGGIDIVVNNAGWSHPNQPVLEVDYDTFRRVYAVNVDSIFHMVTCANQNGRFGKMRVSTIGAGYVGLVTAACLAEIGHTVTCVDKVPDRIDGLNAGRIPIYEPGLDGLVADGVEAGRLFFTTDLRTALTDCDVVMVSDGNLPKFEIIDEWTVRFTWETPNPIFLPAIAGARPLYIYAPAHYLKQFHSRYAAPDDLAAKIAAERVDSWAALHTRKARQYRAENPDLPTLGP